MGPNDAMNQQIRMGMPSPAPMVNQYQQNTNQFYWTNGRAMVDAWPVANNGQVIFIDPDAMKLYIKKADQYGRPYAPEVYKLVQEEEPKTNAETPQTPQIDKAALGTMIKNEVSETLESMFGGTGLQSMIDKEVKTAISARMSAMFGSTEVARND